MNVCIVIDESIFNEKNVLLNGRQFSVKLKLFDRKRIHAEFCFAYKSRVEFQQLLFSDDGIDEEAKGKKQTNFAFSEKSYSYGSPIFSIEVLKT